MCGIIGYSSHQKSSTTAQKIVQGLKKMEYRGYDSWGVAIAKPGKILIDKKTGAIGELGRNIKNSLPLGIGHTRWATHGGVTKNNAHPHLSVGGRFAVVQNGIVENFIELKKKLQKDGYKFKTQTDTEVIVHLVHKFLKKNDLREASRLAFLELKGRNTFVVLDHQTKTIIAVRQGSPLVVGRSKDEVLLASDTIPLLGNVPEIVYVDDNQLVEICDGKHNIYSAKSGKKVRIKVQKLEQKLEKIDKDGFPHFMIKEIFEQQYTVLEAAGYSEKELRPLVSKIKKAKKVYTLGAGTAAFAAGQIARFLRNVGIDAQELRSYEAESYLSLINKKDLVIAVSQSGETADTLEVIEELRKKRVPIASIVNMVGSTTTRFSDYPYFSRSGPEICVASTKAYTSQVVWGYLLSQTVAGKYKQAQREISQLSKKLKKYFADKSHQRVLKNLVKRILKEEHIFVLGKNQHFYSALEGALKIKEITYKHFEGFSAGELKHGVIALVEKGTYVFGIVGGNKQEKMDVLNALAEVKARGAKVIGIADESHEFFDTHLFADDGNGLDSITKIIPFQLLSYYLALSLGNDPDKPRNLAKSVTVK
jgi:glutamine---fructose-6-phosphate transaminase (isomerizing)